MWLPEDIEAALEWADYQASLCDGCGQPRDESFDESNFLAYHVEAVQCHACAARDRKSRERANADSTDTAGMYYAVERQGD